MHWNRRPAVGSIWPILGYMWWGAVGALLTQAVWHRRALAEWVLEEYRYRKGGLQVWWLLRKERKEQDRG